MDLPENLEDIWDALLEEADKAVRSKTFKDDLRAQAELVYTFAKYYPVVTPAKQQACRAKLIRVVPRLLKVSTKGAQQTVEAILDLAKFPNGFEEISRALKVRADSFRKWEPDVNEDIYDTGGWISDYLLWARNAEIPLGYHFWSAVALLGAACKHKFFMDRGSYYLRMNFYIVMVGLKATGKSAAKDAAVDVLRKANFLTEPNPLVRNRHHVTLLPEDTNQETLVRKLAPWHDEIEGPDGKPQRLLVDSTGFMVLDELSTFLGKSTWNEPKRVPFLTTLYGRDYYDYETVSGGHIVLQNVALSMLACSAPEWLKSAITPLMFGGGFMDRTLFVYRPPVTRSIPTPAPLDPVAAVRLAYFIQHLAKRDKPVEMLPTPEANEWYEAWYDKQPKSSDLTGMSTKRRANHAWKLAGILSISDGSAPWIKQQHLWLAVQLLDHEETRFEQFMDEVNRPPEADIFKWVMNTFKRHGGDMTRSEFYRLCYNKKDMTPPDVKAPPFLKSLIQMGLMESYRSGPGIRYKLTSKGIDK
jgi:hypothetical protein